MQLTQPSTTSSFSPLRLLLPLYLVLAATLTLLALVKYPGGATVFIAFALISNALLLNGFRRNASYFDTFIGLFFWLGFFLKLTIRVAFLDGKFSEPVGVFDGSGAAYDQALTVTSIAFAALLAAAFTRERFFRYPATAPDCADSGLYQFYCVYRKQVLIAFLAVVILIAASNAWLGIYQRGLLTRIVLPLGLNGVYKWLLQFGLASISAFIVRFEIARTGNLTPAAIFIPMAEAFLSNVSLLSRGMILNSSGLAIGAWRLLAALKARPSLMRLGVATLTFAVLFGSSVFAVNFLRALSVEDTLGNLGASTTQVARRMSTPLFIDRWVGIEGVMAVTSSPELGWDLWREAWEEKYDEDELSLYDRRFIDSPYKSPSNKGKVHFISLPGLIAFLFYPGSLAFLFSAVLVLALVAALFEYACYRFCGRNFVLCSLFAQVIAFRFASFGYVPSQSYLLFGTLIMNGVLIGGVDRLLARWYAAPDNT
ncbi:MAG: hypothetical protein JWP36_1835 [Paucimonas sp.]|nr:hypothetical protein [Paucimonas sp.]